MSDATLATERSFAAHGARFVVGLDEVGRGALAGPVCVGAVRIDLVDVDELAGVRDSKVLSPKRREALAPIIESWCAGCAVGVASNSEIDEHGIIGALGLAARRALGELGEIDAIIIDGNVNWLGRWGNAHVQCAVGADGRDLTVAAASVLAKVHRDAVMVGLHEVAPVYEWRRNKGYGSAQHRAALHEHGISLWHRRTWRLLGGESVHISAD